MLEPAPLPPEETADETQFGRHFLGHYLGRAHYELFNEIRREYRKRGLGGRGYTVLSLLGIGDNCTVDRLIVRAAQGGVEVRLAVIEGLSASGLVTLEADRVKLTPAGRQMVIELIAVAQASQARIEDRLAPGEITMLQHLIERIIEAVPPPGPAKT